MAYIIGRNEKFFTNISIDYSIGILLCSYVAVKARTTVNPKNY